MHTARSLGRDGRGAVYVEFLIAFMPLLVFFMCLWQMSRMYTTGLALQHAAIVAARSGAVVFADDPSRYDNADLHKATGKRRDTVEGAALIPLAPFILDGQLRSVKTTFPTSAGATDEKTDFKPSDAFDGTDDGSRVDFVRVRIEATYLCQIPIANRIACDPITRTRTIVREAYYPYQGARFSY